MTSNIKILPITPLLAILLVAAMARSALLVMAVDVPGDGPLRAFEAYQWSRSPHWVMYGMWLPGLIYLGGIASMLVPNPVIAVRLLNTVVGALTAAVVFAYARQVYGSRTAWLTGLAIAVFPLHVTLSASSLSEPSFVLWVVLAECILMRASALGTNAPFAGMLAFGLVALAEMTR
jgi:4-amino-4-deoxy-L-arabinose transferase-like glycosyltransferase